MNFSLFANLTVQEVLQIGDLMTELPRELIHKTPSDGMSGYSDEARLGFSYETICCASCFDSTSSATIILGSEFIIKIPYTFETILHQ